MLAVIDDSNPASFAVLDTDDGVVEWVAPEQIKAYVKSGLKFYKHTELRWVAHEYLNMVKYMALKKEFALEFKLSLYDKIKALSGVVRTIQSPEMGSWFEVDIQSMEDCFFVIFYDGSSSRLYSVTKSGIFCLNPTDISGSYHIGEVLNINGVLTVKVYASSDLLKCIELTIDKELNIYKRG